MPVLLWPPVIISHVIHKKSRDISKKVRKSVLVYLSNFMNIHIVLDDNLCRKAICSSAKVSMRWGKNCACVPGFPYPDSSVGKNGSLLLYGLKKCPSELKKQGGGSWQIPGTAEVRVPFILPQGNFVEKYPRRVAYIS